MISEEYIERTGGKKINIVCHNCSTKRATYESQIRNYGDKEGKYTCSRCCKNLKTTSEKICSRCGISKPRSRQNFGIKNASVDGLKSHCLDCAKEEWKIYYYQNKSAVNERSMAWARKNRLRVNRTAAVSQNKPENKKRCREARRRRISRNPEWYKDFYRRNRFKILAYVHKRNALKKAASGSFTRRDILLMIGAQKGRCAYCKQRSNNLQVEHIVPLSRGGSNYPENLCMACGKCNRQKQSKTPEEWIDRWYNE